MKKEVIQSFGTTFEFESQAVEEIVETFDNWRFQSIWLPDIDTEAVEKGARSTALKHWSHVHQCLAALMELLDVELHYFGGDAFQDYFVRIESLCNQIEAYNELAHKGMIRVGPNVYHPKVGSDFGVRGPGLEVVSLDGHTEFMYDYILKKIAQNTNNIETRAYVIDKLHARGWYDEGGMEL